MLKKYGLWIALGVVAYFTRDKWMPILGMGQKEGDEKAVATNETPTEGEF